MQLGMSSTASATVAVIPTPEQIRDAIDHHEAQVRLLRRVLRVSKDQRRLSRRQDASHREGTRHG